MKALPPAELAVRAWRVWRRRNPNLPPFEAVKFAIDDTEETVTLRDAAGRWLGACRLIHTTRGPRVSALAPETDHAD